MRSRISALVVSTALMAMAGCYTCDVCDDCGDHDPHFGVYENAQPDCANCHASKMRQVPVDTAARPQGSVVR